jgi:hypothetical protein
MSRSAIHIWRSAERNVPGLPPCPEELCEPQYAALVFSKYCSVSMFIDILRKLNFDAEYWAQTCGNQAPRPMDAMLHVRLCVACRNQQCVIALSYVFLLIQFPARL